MSRKAEDRSLVLLHLGTLIAHACELAERSTTPSEQEYRVLTARFEPDLCKWENEVSTFVTVGGVRFANEYDQIAATGRRFYKFLRANLLEAGTVESRQFRLREAISTFTTEVLRCIDHIPIEWEPRLAAAKTPFTTSMMIGDAISGARERLDYFDRYLDPDFFPLYLRRLDRSVAVRLVTTRGDTKYGVSAVRAIAQLAAQEFRSLQVVECKPADMHDRNLRVDHTVFHLGPSANAAGRYPTNFNPADSSANGHQILDDLIASGTVVV